MKKILVVTPDRTFLNDLAVRRKYASEFFLMPAHDRNSAMLMLGATRFDLVILDTDMNRLEGLRLLAYLHRSEPPLPLILIAHRAPDPSEAALAGVLKIVGRPVDFEALLQDVPEALERRKTEGQGGFSLSSFLRVMALEGRTALLELQDHESGQRGLLYYEKGECLAGRCDGAEGKAALRRMSGWRRVFIRLYDPAQEDVQAGEIPEDLLALRQAAAFAANIAQADAVAAADRHAKAAPPPAPAPAPAVAAGDSMWN